MQNKATTKPPISSLMLKTLNLINLLDITTCIKR